MDTAVLLLRNFFTHKDFLPPPEAWPGTLFDPLQILFCGAVNFVYPANYLSRYSCLSLPGLRTIFYHGAMVFTAVTMLLSGYPGLVFGAPGISAVPDRPLRPLCAILPGSTETKGIKQGCLTSR